MDKWKFYYICRHYVEYYKRYSVLECQDKWNRFWIDVERLLIVFDSRRLERKSDYRRPFFENESESKSSKRYAEQYQRCTVDRLCENIRKEEVNLNLWTSHSLFDFIDKITSDADMTLWYVIVELVLIMVITIVIVDYLGSGI